jgi:threonine dehydrogenase-like Zn-dependent dehydrogenase
MTSTLEWPRRLAIVGTGLLGASVGLAARAAGVAQVVGADNDRRELRDALDREAITSRARSVEEAAEGADLIVAATPVRSLAGVLARAHTVNPDAVLTVLPPVCAGSSPAIPWPGRRSGGHEPRGWTCSTARPGCSPRHRTSTIRPCAG